MSNIFGSKRQKSEDPGLGDSSISGQVPTIPFAKLSAYIQHLSGSFDLSADQTEMFNRNVMKLAMDCGRSGLSTTLSGTIDGKTSCYTVVHIMPDTIGFTVTHSHHTISIEKGQTPSHNDDYLKSSALKDLERLGVTGAGTSYRGNISLNQPTARWEQNQNGGGTDYPQLSKEKNSMEVSDYSNTTINSQDGDQMQPHVQLQPEQQASRKPTQRGGNQPQPHVQPHVQPQQQALHKPTHLRGNKIQQSEGHRADSKDTVPMMGICTDETKKWRLQ